jgi:ABC-type lipoprotein release transport system permease subunit
LTGAVWMRARAEMRGRWRALLSAGVLCGLFGAAVLATLAGAERTESAYPDFLERQKAYDLLVSDLSFFEPVFWSPDFDALAALPYVESAARYTIGGLAASGEGDLPDGAFLIGSESPEFARSIQRPLVVEGRMSNPERVDEVTVPYYADNELRRFRVGQSITLVVGGEKVDLTVVGKTVFPGELPPVGEFGWGMNMTAAFLERYAERMDFNVASMVLRFDRRADVAHFQRDVHGRTEGKILAPTQQETHTRSVQGSASLQASALRLLGLFIALTGAMIIGQLLARETAVAGEDGPILRALGFNRSQLFRLGIVRILPAAVIGGVLALVLAWLASPIFPRGIFRSVSEIRGFDFDAGTLGNGALLVTLVVLILLVIPAWRASGAIRREAPAGRPSRIASALSASRVSVTAVAGARLALERGRGRTAVPVFSSLVVVSLGVAAFVAATTFATSLEHMLAQPNLYGRSWDTVVETTDESQPSAGQGTAESARVLTADPDVEAIAFADSGIPLRVFSANGPPLGVPVTGLSIQNLKGSLFTPIVRGHAPQAPDEIVLGPRMIKELGIEFDPASPPTIELALQGTEFQTVKFRVVGQGVIPPLGNFGELGMGVLIGGEDHLRGALIDQSLIPPLTQLLVRWRPGVDPAAVIARYEDRLPNLVISEDFAFGRFADAVSFGGVKGAPLVVGGVLAALGAAGLAHVIVTAIRRRRRDVAILKTIGFVRGQARRVVAWQATITVLVATVIGIPLGVVGGRQLWIQVADNLGVLARPQVSLLVLALLIPSVVVLANIIALLPARQAAHTPPALVLRSE